MSTMHVQIDSPHPLYVPTLVVTYGAKDGRSLSGIVRKKSTSRRKTVIY